MKRQKIRKGLLITAMLLFPITIWYFSPYIIIEGAFRHIINGSAVVFVLMTIMAMFFGRAFCGYLCPMGGLQECAMQITDKPVKKHWKYRSKYVIWILWLSGVIASYILGNGDYKIDFAYMTDHGISVSNIYCYIIYYGIILLFLIPAICFGKRFACHYFCWMAPFMILGKKIGLTLKLPQLHIKSEKNRCISCNQCNKSCPMGIDVAGQIKTGKITDMECINCGACVDQCPRNVLSYSMKDNTK